MQWACVLSLRVSLRIEVGGVRGRRHDGDGLGCFARALMVEKPICALDSL